VRGTKKTVATLRGNKKVSWRSEEKNWVTSNIESTWGGGRKLFAKNFKGKEKLTKIGRVWDIGSQIQTDLVQTQEKLYSNHPKKRSQWVRDNPLDVKKTFAKVTHEKEFSLRFGIEK